VALPGLIPGQEYTIRRGPGGETVGNFTGKELVEKGFPVRLSEKYSQALFEVDRK
jgi:hypothetical protein